MPIRVVLCTALSSVFAGIVASADPIPAPIPKSSVSVELKEVASGMAAPVLLNSPGGDDDRLFITDQAGTVRILSGGSLLSTPFLDVTARLPDLGFFGTKDENDFDERGLLGLAFHPDYATPGADGEGKVYTYTSEPVGPPADFTVTLPVGETFDHQSVIAEWQVDTGNADTIDPSTRRELLRIDQPQFNHNAGMIDFATDGLLYIALGDGGASNDDAPGHGPNGNGQDMSNVLGSMLRIDVDGSNSANGQYGIPVSNPFLGDAGTPDETYAVGFRNPFRFSFDDPTNRLIVGDVGQRNIEEIDIVTAGGNYGWRLKEGSFAFDHTTGEVSDDTSGLPPGLIDPVLEYDHDEGISVIGGYVYRGTAIPELVGKYVFGDFATDFFTPSGRLFVGDLDTGVIEELVLGGADRELGLFVKGFGEDADGELYLLAGTNLGPFGSAGQVFRFTAVPEPTTGMLIVLLIASAAGRRHTTRAAPARSDLWGAGRRTAS